MSVVSLCTPYPLMSEVFRNTFALFSVFNNSFPTLFLYDHWGEERPSHHIHYWGSFALRVAGSSTVECLLGL